MCNPHFIAARSASFSPTTCPTTGTLLYRPLHRASTLTCYPISLVLPNLPVSPLFNHPRIAQRLSLSLPLSLLVIHAPIRLRAGVSRSLTRKRSDVHFAVLDSNRGKRTTRGSFVCPKSERSLSPFLFLVHCLPPYGSFTPYLRFCRWWRPCRCTLLTVRFTELAN